jgi:hypothetical protein
MAIVWGLSHKRYKFIAGGSLSFCGYKKGKFKNKSIGNMSIQG